MSTTTDTPTFEALTGGAIHLDTWLPALDGVADKLRSGAIVADVTCGGGETTIAMARAFPRSAFTGYGPDAGSIAEARAQARDAIPGGAGGRNVRFDVAEAATIPLYAFDLVTTFDGLRDLADPLAVARRVSLALAHGGTWMIVEAEAELPKLIETLDAAGFEHLRIAAQTPAGIVVEAGT